MKLVKCKQCQSQFDVSGMDPGSSFVCGKCNGVVEVPAAAGPVMQPIQPKGHTEMPATTVLSPDEMRKALEAARGGAAPAASSSSASSSSAPRLPAAMQKRAKQKDKSSAARAGGASSAAANDSSSAPRRAAKRAASAKSRSAAPAQPAGRSSSSRGSSSRSSGSSRSAGGSRSSGGRTREPAAEKPKSKAPLIVGVVAVVAVLAIVGVVMSGSGDKGTTEGGNNPATASTEGGGTPAAAGTNGGATDTPPAPQDEWDKFLAMSSVEQSDAVIQRVKAAGEDPSKLKAQYEWFANEKIASNTHAKNGAEMAARAARDADPNLDWVRDVLGEANGLAIVNATIEKCPLAFQFKQEDEEALEAKLEEYEKSPWVKDAALKELEALVARIEKRNAALEAEPRLQAVERIETELRKKPAFQGLQFIRTFADPYVIFQEYPVILGEDGKPDPDKAHINKQRLEKAKLLAAREGRIFQELNRRFLEIFGDRFKLHGTLKKHDRLLVCVMLWDREKFDKWNQEDGAGIGFGVRAYYSPTQKIIVHYIGDEAMKKQDEYPCENDRVQKMSDQVTFHEGTHQLQHEYSNIWRGTPLKDGVVSVRPGRSMWFGEGIAEFMGAAECDRESLHDLKDAKWTHNRILLERTTLVRRSPGMRDLAKKWTIAELLVPDSNQTMASKSSELHPRNQNLMINLFYARGWGLVHFAYYYDNGKYRENLLNYMEAVFDNRFGPEAMAKAFGRPNAKDWGEIEKEFNWYWDELCSRRGGRKFNRATGQPTGDWWIAETAPPTGKYTGEEDISDLFDDEDEDE